jgi:hypothetical protein
MQERCERQEALLPTRRKICWDRKSELALKMAHREVIEANGT